MERSGLEITLDIPDDFGRLSADLELAIFCVLQECLTNIHRHSGSKTATIWLSEVPKVLPWKFGIMAKEYQPKSWMGSARIVPA